MITALELFSLCLIFLKVTKQLFSKALSVPHIEKDEDYHLISQLTLSCFSVIAKIKSFFWCIKFSESRLGPCIRSSWIRNISSFKPHGLNEAHSAWDKITSMLIKSNRCKNIGKKWRTSEKLPKPKILPRVKRNQWICKHRSCQHYSILLCKL